MLCNRDCFFFLIADKKYSYCFGFISLHAKVKCMKCFNYFAIQFIFKGNRITHLKYQTYLCFFDDTRQHVSRVYINPTAKNRNLISVQIVTSSAFIVWQLPPRRLKIKLALIHGLFRKFYFYSLPKFSKVL